MVGDVCFATKADPLQIRRDSGNATLKERSGVLSCRIRLMQNAKDIDQCVEFDKPKLEVPIVFFGTLVFFATQGRTLHKPRIFLVIACYVSSSLDSRTP